LTELSEYKPIKGIRPDNEMSSATSGERSDCESVSAVKQQ